MAILYRTTATSVAGRTGQVATDDGKLAVALAMPQALGGTGRGTNPEQLFAAGYAACFHSALLMIAGQQKSDAAGSSVSAAVGIGEIDGKAGFHLEVALTAHLPGLDAVAAQALVDAAHAVCPYSNATRGNIPVTVAVGTTA